MADLSLDFCMYFDMFNRLKELVIYNERLICKVYLLYVYNSFIIDFFLR